MIADETLTGCCRTGTVWAIEHWDVSPDVMVVAKAVSAGYAPVAAMVVREHVYEAFGDGVPSPSVQSYGGHGASAAAGAKAFEIYETSGWTRSPSGAARTSRHGSGLADHPLVRDIRRVGLWIAIELKDPTTGESLARGLHGRWEVAPLLSRLLLAHGCAAARMSEGLLHVAPPYWRRQRPDFDVIADRIPRVLDAAAAPEYARLRSESTRGAAPTHHERREEGDHAPGGPRPVARDEHVLPNATGMDDFPLMPVGVDQSSILGIITGEQLWHVHAGAKTTVAGFHEADSLAGVEVVPLVFATTPPSAGRSPARRSRRSGATSRGARRRRARSTAC